LSTAGGCLRTGSSTVVSTGLLQKSPAEGTGRVCERRRGRRHRTHSGESGRLEAWRWKATVFCPFCHHNDSRVVDSRVADDGTAIRRRRSCPECGRRFTTLETASIAVVKRSGVTEPFSRAKVVAGVRKACQGRPVDEDALAFLAQRVEDDLRASGCSEISSQDVGLAVLAPLRDLDDVAYVRFSSVYRGFDSLEAFEAEIALLRAERDLQRGIAQPTKP
jgi:transcriptional repressor NrdR